uniref:Threonyl/alanyl tRNA synthetase SAD domain-containing protein n=1 Tax=Alexandrium monilatum TaxID=311494 RepID=A0A7S4T0V0_9DINO
MDRSQLLAFGLRAVPQVGAVLSRPAPGARSRQARSSVGAAPAKRTEPVFLSDTFLLELADCELVEALLAQEPPQGAPAGHVKLSTVLSRTLFHPQGGGQQADTGFLLSEGLPDLPVSFASLRKDDAAILHDSVVEQQVADKWAAAAGKVRVTCRVDEPRRLLAARIHSAGHLLDAAVTAVGLKWVPGKGYHFPDGPYVEYILNEASRKIDPKKAGDREGVVRAIQENLDRLVASGGQVTTRLVDGVRHVAMAGEECPCGGTHVGDIAQIGHIEVKKLQNKQGNVRISYTVAAAA